MNDWWGSTEGLTVCSHTALVQVGKVLPAQGRIVVARLDGAKMLDDSHVFFAFSDALLFPGYFGWNWDALSDCLRDLNWLPAEQYLVVVEHAARLLADSLAHRHTLFRVLHRAVQHWASPLGKEPIAFKVLLVCDDDKQTSALRQEIADSTDHPSR
jgi:RNAse (barnase) inhibitor barstar